MKCSLVVYLVMSSSALVHQFFFLTCSVGMEVVRR